MTQNLRNRAPYISISNGCNMDCGYCLAATKVEAGKTMSLADAETLSKWLADQGVMHLGLMGGEPTTHPWFNEITDVFASFGLKFSIPTNGLFNKIKQSAFKKDVYRIAVIHLNDEYFYKGGELKIIRENAKFLADCGIQIEVRYVIHMPKIPIDFIYNFANYISAKTVNFSIARPEGSGGSFYIPARAIRLVMPDAKRAVEFFRAQNFFSSISSVVFPLCVISGYEDIFMSRGSGFCSRVGDNFDSSIVINPDLTADVCTSVPISTKRRVVDFRDLDEVKEELKPPFEQLRAKPLFRECLDCPDFNIRCQGGCLVYKYIS